MVAYLFNQRTYANPRGNVEATAIEIHNNNRKFGRHRFAPKRRAAAPRAVNMSAPTHNLVPFLISNLRVK